MNMCEMSWKIYTVDYRKAVMQVYYYISVQF